MSHDVKTIFLAKYWKVLLKTFFNNFNNISIEAFVELLFQTFLTEFLLKTRKIWKPSAATISTAAATAGNKIKFEAKLRQ